MHLTMLSPRVGGPRAYVGHLIFQKNFWSKSPPWGPKIGSNQIKYLHLFHQFMLKMSSEKSCFCINIKTRAYVYLKQPSFRTDEHMGRCDLVPFLRAKKANVPTVGPRLLVKYPRVGKAIEVKCPTYARGPPPPPSGLTLIDALQCIRHL